MKRFSIVIIVCIAAILVSSCQSTPIPSTTQFYSFFSIGEMTAAQSQYLRTGSSQVHGGFEFGPDDFLVQRNEEIRVLIDAANIPEFMKAIQSDIEDTIVTYGGKVVGEGNTSSSDSSSEYFSLQYQLDGFQGIVNVWGVSVDGDYLNVLVLITEKSPEDLS